MRAVEMVNPRVFKQIIADVLISRAAQGWEKRNMAITLLDGT